MQKLKSQLLLLLFPLASYSQQVDWPSLTFTQITTNTLPAAIRLAAAGDGSGRLFVLQSQRVWIVQSNSVLLQPFLDLSSRADIRQMIGLAFPPGLATNSHFYIYYERSPDNAACLSRFVVSADPNIADTNSEQVLLVVSNLYGGNIGGQIDFGPDGFLYVGSGDGGSNALAQATRSLLGKVLRIDVESGQSPYSIPTNNPFFGNTNYAPEIFALGFRTPWTFSFDRLTGDLYLSDSAAYQEIDFQPGTSKGGQNYGWPIRDGPVPYQQPIGFDPSTLTGPVAWYDRSLGSFVMGGYVYRGPHEPRMDGVYFYGDFYSGRIWGLVQVGTNWQSFQLAKTPYSIAAFGQDEQGAVYLADYWGGKIYKIQDSHQVLTPSFSAPSGIINSNAVTVTCVTPGAAIHYTTNGLDPTEIDAIISSGGTLQVSTGITNKIRAFRSDLTPSAIVASIFTVQVGTPNFTPQSPITNGTSILISCATPGAVIYYTLDGSTPTTNSPVYSGPLTINAGVTLSALGVEAGYLDSTVTSVYYSLTPVATPVFNPAQGLIAYGTAITISCATPGAVIRYTLDGTAPTTNSAIYSAPLILNSRAILNAQAYRSDLSPSGLQGAAYTLFNFEHTVVTTLAGGTTAGFSNAVGPRAMFSHPQGICIDQSGNWYVADRSNNVIRKILPSGQVTTFAGTGVAGSQLGPVTNAQFAAPTSVCLDKSGNLYVDDPGNCNRICRITNGIVTAIPPTPSCALGPAHWQIETDAGGNVYVGAGMAVVKITPSGTATQIAGIFPEASSADECISGWCPGVGLGIDSGTNLYITTAAVLYKLTPDGVLSLFAGNPPDEYGGPRPGYSDGPRLLALFAHPQFQIFALPVDFEDAVVDSATNVFVSDSTRIRKISSSGWVSTVAGTGDVGYRNGPGSVAQFNGVTELCLDTNGIIYVADAGNNCIRKISPDTYGIGIPDWWQLAHFGYVGIDPNADPDKDGMSNFAEFLAGTDPNDPNSRLRLNSIDVQPSGVLLNWTGGPNSYEYVQRCSSMIGTNAWQDIFTNPPSLSASGSYLDTSATNGPYFYRIRVGWQ